MYEWMLSKDIKFNLDPSWIDSNRKDASCSILLLHSIISILNGYD